MLGTTALLLLLCLLLSLLLVVRARRRVDPQPVSSTTAPTPPSFYGKSQPFDNLSTDNLRYLSSQQALADTAAFVTAFKANRTMPEHTAVVVYGGSYSGALAAFFRTKYGRAPPNTTLVFRSTAPAPPKPVSDATP